MTSAPRLCPIQSLRKGIEVIRAIYTEFLQLRLDNLEYASYLLEEAILEYCTFLFPDDTCHLINLVLRDDLADIKQEKPEYEVASILDHCTDDQGDWFLVQWCRYDEPTWEPADHLYPNTMDMVHEYFKKMHNRRKTSSSWSLG